MEELKDIKGAQVIPNSFLEYGSVVLFGLILSGVLIALLVYFIKRKKKKITQEQIAIQTLKNLDFTSDTNAKDLAYQFTILGSICVQEHCRDEYLSIVNKLERYKYTKETQIINADLKSQMQEYIKAKL
jgi:hypothetical protein